MGKSALILITCLICLLPVTLSADSESTKARLLQKLATANNESDGRIAESAVWEFWFDQAPTAEVRTSLDAGRERIQAYDYEAAENHLDDVVEKAPNYAEGYNQRAWARFLREKYSESLTDLEKVIELEPHHFGALSGMYHILRLQNRTEAAFSALKRAVAIHPWIQERGALPKDQWPDAYRKIHEPGLEI